LKITYKLGTQGIEGKGKSNPLHKSNQQKMIFLLRCGCIVRKLAEVS